MNKLQEVKEYANYCQRRNEFRRKQKEEIPKLVREYRKNVGKEHIYNKRFIDDDIVKNYITYYMMIDEFYIDERFNSIFEGIKYRYSLNQNCYANHFYLMIDELLLRRDLFKENIPRRFMFHTGCKLTQEVEEYIDNADDGISEFIEKVIQDSLLIPLKKRIVSEFEGFSFDFIIEKHITDAINLNTSDFVYGCSEYLIKFEVNW